MSVYTLDCDYLYPQFAASFLMTEGDRALFVETNTAHAVPRLLASLQQTGFRPDQVEWIIVTHAHLDHAGGTSALLEACPQATVLAHPKAARHLIDPSRLISSAERVYGASRFKTLYGEIKPIESDRVRAVVDGEEIQFGERKLQFFFTRGHANHHLCLLDTGTRGVFTGDAFGLRYPALQAEGLFIFPSTSPIDFNAQEARASIHKILATGAHRAYLTHFGEVTDLEAAAAQLLEHLDFCEELQNEATRSSVEGEELIRYCEKRVFDFFKELLIHRGLDDHTQLWDLLDTDLHLNAAGIAYAATQARKDK